MALIKCENCSNEQDEQYGNTCLSCGQEIGAAAQAAEAVYEEAPAAEEAAPAEEAAYAEEAAPAEDAAYAEDAAPGEEAPAAEEAAPVGEAPPPASTIGTCEFCGHQQDTEISRICDNCGRKMGRTNIAIPKAAPAPVAAPENPIVKCEYCAHEQDITVSRICDNCGRKLGRTSMPPPAPAAEGEAKEATRCPICSIPSKTKVCPNCGNVKRT